MNDDLLKEARRIDYRLRSTFFYRKLHELGFLDFARELDVLVKIDDSYNGWRGANGAFRREPGNT